MMDGMLKILILANVICFSGGDNRANNYATWAEDDFDFIVVGAGAAGAAVANRLSEDNRYKVLLLEAGGEVSKFNRIPYFAPGPLFGDAIWQDFFTEPQKHSCLAMKNQKYFWFRGKGLGGTTLINGMYYTRGNRRDYDTWAELGNDGWSFDDVLPYFIKLEDFDAETTSETAKYHGKGGPMTASRPPYKTPVADAFLEAGKELGYDRVDYNAATQTGFDNPVYTLKKGQRWSTLSAYIDPARHRPNLRIVIEAFVTKVMFDEHRRATGVLFEKQGKLWFVSAKKEVIVSGGAVSSPPLLLHSGMGPKEHLNKIGVPVVTDLPGVGQNLQDHVATVLVFTLEKPVATDLQRDATVENLVLWETEGKGPLTMPVRGEGVAFMNSRYADLSIDYPDFELMMTSRPPFTHRSKELEELYGDIPDPRDIITIYPIILRPKSVGYIELRSSDPHDVPVFQPQYLSHVDDVKLLIEAAKGALEVINTKAFQKYGAKLLKFTPPECQQYVEFSDDFWECLVRQTSFGFVHQAGSCKMAPANDPMAVVDSRLRVYNVTGLRVIDMSITPTLITGHTMIPAVMIGEKGADMILEDWKKTTHHSEL